MKVLTLHQPYATLIALGVKTIETRSWPSPRSLIGERIAIHAAQRAPAVRRVGDWFVEPWYEDPRHVDDCECDNGEVLPECARRSVSRPVMRRLTRDGFGPWVPLPLGAIVTSARVEDSLPMVNDWKRRNCIDLRPLPNRLVAVRRDDEDGVEQIDDATLQRPYGDFTPGRWGWLLADNEPLAEPVPFKGGQGLTKSWEP